MKKLYSILLTIITFSLGTFVTSCSTTTHFSLMDNNRYYIEKQIKETKKNEDVGVEVSLLLKDGNVFNGELLSVRDSTMTICSEFSAKEEELSENIFPILIISINDIQQLTIEGSSWIWEGIGAGYLVGGLAGVAIGSTFEDSKEKDFGVIGLMIAMGTLGSIAGGITGYAISTEEYIIEEIPTDYDWFILKPLSRYPDEEPEFLKAIK